MQGAVIGKECGIKFSAILFHLDIDRGLANAHMDARDAENGGGYGVWEVSGLSINLRQGDAVPDGAAVADGDDEEFIMDAGKKSGGSKCKKGVASGGGIRGGGFRFCFRGLDNETVLRDGCHFARFAVGVEERDGQAFEWGLRQGRHGHCHLSIFGKFLARAGKFCAAASDPACFERLIFEMRACLKIPHDDAHKIWL